MNLFAALLLIVITPAAWADITINVAPNGNPNTTLDELKKTPNVPATLERALTLLKSPELHDATGARNETITIQLAPGTYRLNETLKLDSASSGSAEHPVTIQGSKAGDTIITGGKAVNGFEAVTDPAVLTRLPEAARPHVLQSNLPKQGIADYGKQERHGWGAWNIPTAMEVTYRNQPMTLARWPNTGFAKIAATPDGEKGNAFTMQGANLAAWKDEPELLAIGYWFQDWADATIPIKTIDLASQRITLTEPNPPYGIKTGNRVFIQNALTELDQPGEWYLDKTHGILYFWPPDSVIPAEAGIQPKKENAVVLPSPAMGITNDLAACCLSQMASSSIRGAGGEGAPNNNAVIPAKAGTQPSNKNAVIPAQAGIQRLKNNAVPPNPPSALSLSKGHSETQPLSVEISLLEKLLTITNATHIRISNLTFQSARGDAITVQGGHHITITNSIIRNIGNRAAVVSGQDNGLTDMLIENIGHGGVVLAGGDRQTLIPANLYIEYSTIRHFARVMRTYQPGVLLSGVGNRVVGNQISDTPHTAVLFSGNDHIISLNDIHDVCKETDDAGAIYSGRDWTARGTVISFNYIHNIENTVAKEFGVMGVYLDDQASGITIRNNVFEKIETAIYIGGGRDNLVENNFFIQSSKTPLHLDARGAEWQKKEVENKASELREKLMMVPYNRFPYQERYSHLANILDDEIGMPKYNVARNNVSIGNSSLEVSKHASTGIAIDRWTEIYSLNH